MRSDWVEFIRWLTSLLVSIFSVNRVYFGLNLALSDLNPDGFYSMSDLSIFLLMIKASPSVWWSSNLPEYSTVCPDSNVLCPDPVQGAPQTPRMSRPYFWNSLTTWASLPVWYKVLTFPQAILVFSFGFKESTVGVSTPCRVICSVPWLVSSPLQPMIVPLTLVSVTMYGLGC